MYLEFIHEVKGIWGYYSVKESSCCFDGDVVSMVFRELRKDRSAELWLMDVDGEVDFESITRLSLSWVSWEDYDNNIVTMAIHKDHNWDVEYMKMPWEKGKRAFRDVIKSATSGGVKVAKVFGN